MIHTMLAVLVLTLAATLAFAAGCNTDGAHQVRGQVVEVVPRSFSELELLRIRSEEGILYAFETEGFVGFTPSHLREHSLFGQTVLVTYREEDGRLVAVRTED